MMQLQTLEACGMNAPVNLDIEASGSGFVLRARWQDGDRDRELALQTSSDETGLQTLRRDFQALLKSCYEAGFADASNPRFFVP